MRNLILALTLITSGCSPALIERLSTDKYWSDSKDTEPHVSEHATGVPDTLGVSKRLIIHNPLQIGIRAFVKCSSIYQADLWYHVNARSVRYILITAPREHTQSCVLEKYYADDVVIPIEEQ